MKSGDCFEGSATLPQSSMSNTVLPVVEHIHMEILPALLMPQAFDGACYGCEYLQFNKHDCVVCLPHLMTDADWSYGALFDKIGCSIGWFPTAWSSNGDL